MLNRFFLGSLGLLALLFACSDASTELPNPNDPKEQMKRNMLGTWQLNLCYLDLDSQLFNASEVVTFRADGSYQLDISLYEPADWDCVGDPIARTIESGNYFLRNPQTSSNNNLPAFEIDFHAAPEETQGNLVLGIPALDPRDAVNLYSLIYVDDVGELMYLGDNFARRDNVADRSTVLSWQHSKIESLPQNYESFLPIPDYTAPVISDLQGTWAGICFHLRSDPHLHKMWVYDFNASNSTVRETVYDGGDCSAAFERGSNTYNISLSIPENVTTANLAPVMAAGVNMTINSSTSSGDTTYLTNYANNRVLTESMLLDTTYNVILESEGTGTNNQDRPTFINRFYQRVN